MSAAQLDNGAGAGCQASTQLDPVALRLKGDKDRLTTFPPSTFRSCHPIAFQRLGICG
jgi:hypothetical protein